MGSSASKATRAGASATARKYPTTRARIPPTPSSTTSSQTNAPPTSAQAGQRTSPGPTVHPQPTAHTQRTEAVNLDASDPFSAYSQQLRQLGAVQPTNMYSPSSTFNSSPGNQPSIANASLPTTSAQQAQRGQGQQQEGIFPNPRRNPALVVLAARDRLQQEAEKEFMQVGRRGSAGRSGFLDVMMIRQILMLRDERGESVEGIEKQLGLQRGVVGRLGGRGIVAGT